MAVGLLPTGVANNGGTGDGNRKMRRAKAAEARRAGVRINDNDTEQVEEQAGDAGTNELDDRGNVIRIRHPDGSVTIRLDGQPVKRAVDESPKGWFENLVEKIEENEKGRIVDDLMRGIEDDIQSRQEWVDTRERGIDLLGLTFDEQSEGGSPDGVAVEGQSQVKHPLLLEAVLRFQANARSEMLPTDGPVKIRDDDNNAPSSEDALASALEKDFNHYLTVTDKAYYPDTDRMLLWLGFGGTTFKKVYFDALKNRPLSVSVDPDDLIVNNATITLAEAPRITHRTVLPQSVVRRMQLLGIYANVDLGTPEEVKNEGLRRKKRQLDGASESPLRPQDRPREIYECYCELDILGHEFQWDGENAGLPVPYIVTIDVSSKKMLACSRNYDKPKKGQLPERLESFVDYHFVPGLGFYGIGLLHILANPTLAVTAAWRELLDAGMFASFPGFLYAKSGARQNTNIFRVPPGGGAEIDTFGQPIKDAVMPLPYQTQGMQALMALVENIVQTSEKVGMTAESQVGEGKQNAPVGTTLALIEQQQKILNSVHKRMHASQAEEFQLLAKVFKRHPEAYWMTNKAPALPWDEKTFIDALDNYYLVPQADPNTASQMQRIAKVGALLMLAKENPNLYDIKKLHELALRTLGWGNPDEFMKPDDQASQPTPEQQAMMADLDVKKAMAQAKTLDAQTKAKQVDGKLGLDQARLNLDQNSKQTEFQLKAAVEKINAGLKGQEIQEKVFEGLTAEKMNLIDAAQNLAVHPESAHLVAPLIQPAYEDVMKRENQERTAKHGTGGLNDVAGPPKPPGTPEEQG